MGMEEASDEQIQKITLNCGRCSGGEGEKKRVGEEELELYSGTPCSTGPGPEGSVSELESWEGCHLKS